ncbi:hypothetical protein EBT31_21260 [bacterium]|nr:hypothetical protein [bacterium]
MAHDLREQETAVTQNDAIKQHLLAGKPITPLDALQNYGCFRLAARIDELRKAGLDIETLTEKRNGKQYASYVLRGQLQMVGL